MSKSRKSVYKVILVGDPRVGKTSLRHRYLGKGFNNNYMVTLGADFAIHRLGSNVIQIWDLAGQPVYKTIRKGYYNGAQGILLVFDITRRDTFNNISSWLDEVNSKINSKLPMIVVGNKGDLRDGNSVTIEEAQIYAKSLTDWSGFEIPYIETSALTGLNVNDAFLTLIKNIEIMFDTMEGQ